MDLRQSTIVALKIGPFLDATDGTTEETGITPVFEVSKAGGAFAARNSATAITHDAEGWYIVTLSATDTNTLGGITLKAQDSATHLPIFVEHMVMVPQVWDSLYGADVLQVDLLQMGGDAQSSTDLKDFADAGYDPATNKVQGVVLTDTVTTYTGNTLQTGDAFARLGAPIAASISADLAIVDALIDTMYAALITGKAQLASVPAHGASALDKLAFVFMAMKNATVQNGTTHTVSNDAGTVIGTANTTFAAGEFTKAKFA